MAPAPLLSDSARDIDGLLPKKQHTDFLVTGEARIFQGAAICCHISDSTSSINGIAKATVLR